MLDRHQESGSAEGSLGHGLTWAGRSTVLGGKPEHILNLLGLVFLPTTENVGFAAIGITNFMHLGLCERLI